MNQAFLLLITFNGKIPTERRTGTSWSKRQCPKSTATRSSNFTLGNHDEIGRPQKAFLDVADRITGSVLDSGCGTGETALYFAARGQKVIGIDFLAEPVEWAKKKAVERGVTATFTVMDALSLKELPEVFDNVIDSGLFHVFSDEDRKRYVEGLASVLKPGGRFFLLCFSDAEPGVQGPRRVSRK